MISDLFFTRIHLSFSIGKCFQLSVSSSIVRPVCLLMKTLIWCKSRQLNTIEVLIALLSIGQCRPLLPPSFSNNFPSNFPILFSHLLGLAPQWTLTNSSQSPPPHPDIQAGDDDCDDVACGDGVANADANENADGNDDDDEVAGSGELQLQLQLQLQGLWTPGTHSPAVQSLHFIMYARHRQWATDGRAAIALPLVASSSN